MARPDFSDQLGPVEKAQFVLLRATGDVDTDFLAGYYKTMGLNRGSSALIWRVGDLVA